MAEPQSGNVILFGAEFDPEKFRGGVKDLLNDMEKVQEAEVVIKESIKETTDAMKENRKAAEDLQKQLEKTFDPAKIEEQEQALASLNKQFDELIKQKSDLLIVQKKVNEVEKDMNKQAKETEKNNEKVGKAVEKFTNINELAADGVKKIGGYAKEAAFSFVSGFAGGLLAMVIPSLIKFGKELLMGVDYMEEFNKRQAISIEIQEGAAKIYANSVSKLELIRQELNDSNNSQAQRVKLAQEYNKTAEEGNQIDITQINNLDLINEKIAAQITLLKQRAIAKAAENVLAAKAEDLFKAQINLETKYPQFGDAAVKKIDDQVKKIVEAKAKALKVSRFNSDEILQMSDLPRATIEQLAKSNAQFGILLDDATAKELAKLRQQKDILGKIREGEGSGAAGSGLRNQFRELFKQEIVGTIPGLDDMVDDVEEAREEFNRVLSVAGGLIDPEGLIQFSKPKTQKEIENVFLQKLKELQAKLASVTAQQFESEPLIREKFRAALDKELLQIGRLIQQGKLTLPQGTILKGLLDQINEKELDIAIQNFRRKQAEALQKIDDLIAQNMLQAEQRRVANIRDEFEREKATIEQNFDASVQAVNTAFDKFVKQLNLDVEKGLISPEGAKRKRLLLSLITGDLTNQAEQAKINAELNLAFRIFQRTLEAAKLPFENERLNLSEETTQQIRELTAAFLQGEIRFEKYQKRLTEIMQKESRQRRRILLEELNDQLNRVNKQLETTTDAEQKKALEKQQRDLRNQISQARREELGDAANGENSDAAKRAQRLIEYTQAVSGLLQQVASFWNAVNQIEQQALDRSIALQNRRVENAREIAERGNAEYLELEQKRLDELERKREENARRQLAINNALTLSQATLAAITAIAQAAQSGNPAAAIAAVAAVVGAITAAYQFVNSLQPQNPSFYTGTEYVDGARSPLGRDTVKANLHIGERVVTSDTNRAYWDSLSAIHNHVIPPDVLNSFVNAYNGGGIPMLDYDRLGMATEGAIATSSLESMQLDRMHSTMERVVGAIEGIGIKVNMDEDGFEAAIGKASRQRKLRNRA